MAREKTATFEQLYARLEESVAKLEQGGLSLEEAIGLYEEGMGLARQCQERLDQAELKITKLKESFASLPARTNETAAAYEDVYEYVADEEPPEDRQPA